MGANGAYVAPSTLAAAVGAKNVFENRVSRADDRKESGSDRTLAQCSNVAHPWPGTWTWKVLPPIATLTMAA
jgi:hypothetical protein